MNNRDLLLEMGFVKSGWNINTFGCYYSGINMDVNVYFTNGDEIQRVCITHDYNQHYIVFYPKSIEELKLLISMLYEKQ